MGVENIPQEERLKYIPVDTAGCGEGTAPRQEGDRGAGEIIANARGDCHSARQGFLLHASQSLVLGVHTIARILRGSGIECRIFNAVRARGRPQRLPEELSYLSKYLGKEFFFKSYQRFGILPGHLAEELRRYGPDRVFVSCFAFCYACEAIETIDAIKHELPGIDIVVGDRGTCNPKYFLGNSRADFVAVGEADDIAVDIAEGPGPAKGLCAAADRENLHPGSPDFRPVP
jgi:hypothetical protein